MNIYSVLDDSDDERPKATAKKVKESKEAPQKSNAAVSSDNKSKAKADAPKTKATEVKTKQPTASDVDGDNTKENNRGGKPRHQQHKEIHPRKFKNDETQPRRPKREFDRKSGTGRGREVSKGGRGSFGAGNVEQDAMEAEKNPEGVVDAVAGEVEAETEDANENAVPEEPEIPTFTLDEYLEKRNAARLKVSSMFGETKSRAVDESVFNGTVAKVADELDAVAGKQSRKKDKPTIKAQTVEVSFKFEPPQQERGGRGFRGGRSDEERGRGGRGGRRSDGRSGGRGAPRASAVLNLDDFPSL